MKAFSSDERRVLYLEDSKIIELFEDRNEDAVSKASEKYGAYCIAVAKNILESDEDTDECMNDVYFSLWNSIPPNKPKNLKAYMSKICRNIALNKIRAQNTEKRGGKEAENVFDEISEFVSGKENTEKSYEQKELIEEINRFLKKQQKEKRKIFVLRYWYFESFPNIAKRFGKSEDSIRNTLFRTRKKLKKYLSERGFEP